MKSKIERINVINQAVKEIQQQIDNKFTVPTGVIDGWRDGELIRPIIKIDHSYLMFRIENSRTTRQQQAYLHDNPDIEKDIFTDPESATTQAAQESILISMINNSQSGKEFLVDLSSRGQKIPAIITHDGYLINGNRRTAALKELNKSYVKCLVLPSDANTKDIYSIEHEYQIAKDFREDYHWINELLNYRKGVFDSRIHFTFEEMALKFRITEKELKSKLRILEIVDEYLEWVGKKNQYDYETLDQSEQAFHELEKFEKRINNPHQNLEFKYAAFSYIENPPSRGRIYTHIGNLYKNWEDTIARIQAQISSANSPIDSTSNNQTDATDILNDLLDVEDEMDAVSVFDNSDETSTYSQMLFDTVEDIRAEKKEIKSSEALYDGVSSALRELTSLTVEHNSTKLAESKQKLMGISEIIVELLKSIEEKIG